MTRSIFDPTGGETERSGSTFTPPDANQISHLPAEFDNVPTSESAGSVDFQPPPEKPRIEVAEENGGRLLVVRLTGRLHKEDYRKAVPMLEDAIRRHGKVRVLVLMHSFHGLDAGAWWEDVKFDVKHLNDVERLAIVGEKEWEQWIAMFKPFTTASIQYFSAEEEAAARRWVTA